MSQNSPDRLSQILPAFYVLASGDWMRTRDYIHDGTPGVILEKLATLGDPLVDEVLASRNI